MKTCNRIGDSKTPDPDGVPNVALETAILVVDQSYSWRSTIRACKKLNTPIQLRSLGIHIQFDTPNFSIFFINDKNRFNPNGKDTDSVDLFMQQNKCGN